jgi:DNA-binding PadR family transcriptional regulator
LNGSWSAVRLTENGNVSGGKAVRAGTKYAVLGLLRAQPGYGYEILVRFRRAFDAADWDISPQGLYSALDRLERDGLIEPVATRDADASRRQPKTPYRLTRAGTAELRRFLATPMAAAPSSAELLVRLQCVADDDAGALSTMLDAHEHACREELRHIGDETPAELDAATAEVLVERLVREERRLAIRARLTWIDYTRRQLRDAAPAPSGGPQREVVGS